MYSMSEGEIKKLKSRIQELAKKLGSITLLIRRKAIGVSVHFLSFFAIKEESFQWRCRAAMGRAQDCSFKSSRIQNWIERTCTANLQP